MSDSFTGITERVRALESIKISEEKFRLLYHSLADPIWILQYIGEDFILYDYNDAAALVTAGDICQFLGQSLRVLRDKQPELVAFVHECFGSAAPRVREISYTPPSATSPRTFCVTFVVLAPTTVVLIGNDITELKRLQAQLGKC